MNLDKPASPITIQVPYDDSNRTGLTKREYAAIHLRVPDSGDPELNAMIRTAQRNELAARAMQGIWSNPDRTVSGEDAEKYGDAYAAIAVYVFYQADTMLKEGEK